MNLRSSEMSICARCCRSKAVLLLRKLPALTSAIATRRVLPLGTLRAWPAAPVPRPPAPTRATLMVSLPPAWTWGSTAPARAEAAVTLSALRRERTEFFETLMLSPGTLTESTWISGWLQVFIMPDAAGRLKGKSGAHRDFQRYDLTASM